MIGRSYQFSRDDPAALARAAAALREWDAGWDLAVPDRFARLYEPDGTLFAFSLGRPMTVFHNHRAQALGPGDLIVVPRELALDIEPELDLLALRHEGEPPDHFRERFIQVWGFEHLRAAAPAGTRELIARDDARYPLAYALAAAGSSNPVRGSTGLECALLIAVDGATAVVGQGGATEERRLPPGDALLLGPAIDFAIVQGTTCGIVTLFNALVQQARHAAAPARPEFDPAAR